LVIIVPSFINIALNVRIFIYARSSTRRVQPQIINSLTNAPNIQQTKISRREISLLRQMIFMFSMFIGGWSPSYFITVINDFIIINPIIYQCAVLLCEISLLSIIINLFMNNRELRQYLLNKIRLCFGHQ
jgi:hypothetical protein